MSDLENLQTIALFWQRMDQLEFEAVGELLHDDFVCDWPQSGEHIRGRANFIALNKHYPGDWSATIVRLLAGQDNHVISEVRLTYQNDLVFAVSIFALCDGKIVKETDYWPEPYSPPDWRAPWVETV